MCHRPNLKLPITDTHHLRLRVISLFVSFLVITASEQIVHAGVIMNFTESGGNVDATAVGTIDLAGLTFEGTGPGIAAVVPDSAVAVVGPNETQAVYHGATGPTSMGPGSAFTAASIATGQDFGVGFFGAILVPAGYVSESQLSGTATWTGQTFASLGLTPGTYVYSWGSGPTADTLTVNVTSVPEPATIWLAAIGAVVFAAHARFARSM
jgi:PEP-CTERM motif